MREAQLRCYLQRLRRHLQAYRFYPYEARRLELEGVVWLLVRIGPSGRLLGVRVLSESAPRPLREAALSMLRRAHPLPPPPPALGSDLRIRVPVVFRLEDAEMEDF